MKLFKSSVYKLLAVTLLVSVSSRSVLAVTGPNLKTLFRERRSSANLELGLIEDDRPRLQQRRLTGKYKERQEALIKSMEASKISIGLRKIEHKLKRFEHRTEGLHKRDQKNRDFVQSAYIAPTAYCLETIGGVIGAIGGAALGALVSQSYGNLGLVSGTTVGSNLGGTFCKFIGRESAPRFAKRVVAPVASEYHKFRAALINDRLDKQDEIENRQIHSENRSAKTVKSAFTKQQYEEIKRQAVAENQFGR